MTPAASRDRDRSGPPGLLVADESPAVRELVGRYSRHESFRLLVASDCREALELARSEKPAIVMASVSMPGLEASDLCAEVRRLRAPEPAYCVLLVSREGTRRGLTISASGIDDFMATPFSPGEFFSRIRNALRVIRAEEELAESQHTLFRAEKLASLGVMAGGIAHEFNNIFGAIVGYCELALDHGGTDQMHRALEVTLESAERATSITRNLLGFAREQPPSIRSVGLSGCVDRILSIMGPGLRKRGIEVVRSIGEAGPVRGDAGQLEQVIFNVVQNAEHAMESGGTLTISLAPGGEAGRVCLRISDTGVGMTDEQMERAFEPFYTTKGAYGRGATHGTGLGLSVAHGIVEAHGGRISLESARGEGTSVSIDLPVVSGPPREAVVEERPPAEEVVTEAPALRELSILAVDDEPRILEVLQDMLAGFGHSTDVARTVDQAVEMFGRKHYDLVFTDVVMPGRDGWELLDELRGLRPDIPVVFVTGSIGDNTRRRSRQVGALACIYKPFRSADVEGVLATFAARFPKKVVSLRLPPELDRQTCEALSARMFPRLRESESDLELDLGAVGYLSSFGVAMLLKIYSELNRTGRRLTLANVTEHVFEVLELTGLAGGGLEGLVVRRRIYGSAAPGGLDAGESGS